MSQAKVDRYKEEKSRRKEILAKEKRKHNLTMACLWIVAVLIVGWAGYSAYHIYDSRKPAETIYANLDAVNDYVESLDTEE